MNIIDQIKEHAQLAIKNVFEQEVGYDLLTVNLTKPEFEGDYTLVLFSFVKQLRKSPEQIGALLGENMVQQFPEMYTGFNVIKGFLNLVVTDAYWINYLQNNYTKSTFTIPQAKAKKIVLEYASPNTNKPLHLGHLRNIFLGWSMAQILHHCGHDVVKTCIVNDRGIHICKSMLAWQKLANGGTPQSSNMKGDHFVGHYYVLFENELKAQAQPIIDRIIGGDISGFNEATTTQLEKLTVALAKATEQEKQDKIKDDIKEIGRNQTPIMQEAREMLQQWEAGNEEVLKLWKKMNGWVYEGFDATYNRIGADFAKTYYESETYLPGKKFVEAGLEQGIFYKKEDNSTWVDLTPDGLDEKLLLRGNGTSVYITQDLGLAEEKYEDFKYDESSYVIADEQNYHMKVLKLILQKLGKPYADGIFHLSYGMVELPTGRMKSREGTVVDADDIMDEMAQVAKAKTEELGKVKDFSQAELEELYETIGLGALKFFLLRVDPKKKMIFNPEESIEFQGFTGTFIQYTHARIKSLLRKQLPDANATKESTSLHAKEKAIIVLLEQYDSFALQAAQDHNPSLIAIYVFEVAKTFNTLFAELSVLSAETEEKKHLRLQISQLTASVIASAMQLLGVKVPERM